MKNNTTQNVKKVHDRIVLFLKDDSKYLFDKHTPKTNTSRLLDFILNPQSYDFDNSFHVERSKILQVLEMDSSELSNAQKELNSELEYLSDTCQLPTPIRIYFSAEEVENANLHLSFQRSNEKEKRSSEHVPLFPLQMRLKIAEKILKKEKGEVVEDELDDKSLLPHRVDNVLEINSDKDAQWFRRSGPLAVDFNKGFVYPREGLLKELRELVFENSIAILEGKSATGKSVLARHCTYRLCEEEEYNNIYFFNCKYPEIFDADKVFGKVKDLCGIIIIEDIHLDTPQIQLFVNRYQTLDNTSHKLLLVGRSQYRDNQLEHIPCKLQDFPNLYLEPFEEVDEIIEHYRETEDLNWSDGVKNKIKKISEEDFWLLSFALKGCHSANAKGENISWIKKGVENRLQKLAKLDEEYGSYFPSVLVALSPLYKEETLTHCNFLTSKKEFGFDIRMLNRLVKMGEITEYPEDDDIYYGLPHSSLAKAYLEHGQQYWDKELFPTNDVIDFVFKYAASGTPNSVEAIVMTDKVTKDKLISKLCEPEHKEIMVKIIENETSKGMIAVLIDSLPRDVKLYGYPNLLSVLAKKFNTPDDHFYEGLCLSTIHKLNMPFGEKLVTELEKESLAKKMSASVFLYEVASCINFIRKIKPDIAHSLCQSLTIEQLVSTINQETNLRYKDNILSAIIIANRRIGQKYWKKVDKNLLVNNLLDDANEEHVDRFLKHMFKLNKESRTELTNVVRERFEISTGNTRSKSQKILLLCETTDV